jgi:tyrosine-protein kinase Etk/Wzc
MNAPQLLQPQMPLASLTPVAPLEDDGVDLVEYWDIIVDRRWLVATVATIIFALGVAYAFLARPIFETNLLIQVEDSSTSAKSFFGDAASLFDIKTPAGAEMEIIGSRFILGNAVDNMLLYVEARPNYFPLIGGWLARHSSGLSDPGFLGFAGYVTGTEKISVSKFDVPQSVEDTKFTLTGRGHGQYVLSHPNLEQLYPGQVNEPFERSTPLGTISLMVTRLDGNPGAEFTLIRRPRLKTIEGLQQNLKLVEKGRQTGVIDVRLQSGDPRRLSQLLHEIGLLYVQQNIQRKAAEAQKTLTFLDTQMPQFKQNLAKAEAAYNKYRQDAGTISLDEEAKTILGVIVDLNSKLLDAEQKRRDLISRFTPQHPLVKTLDEQIAGFKQQIAKMDVRVHKLPAVQQDALRLQRDVQVNNDAFQSLQQNKLQLQLVREGKVGNVRVIDDAAVPVEPVKPKRLLVIVLAAVLGLLGGITSALARNSFARGIRNPQELEAHTGLSVYSTIPLSATQAVLARQAANKEPGVHLLALTDPRDPAIESLRSLRTALQFAMIESTHNRVLVTGATPGVGKSFICANFAALLANAGSRVLLIDADLRKGYLNHHFGLPRERGLSEVVAGTLKGSDAIHRNVIPNLDLLTTGVLPPNPAELMMSAALGHVLNELSAAYDLIIMDTPPVLVAADTTGIASNAGIVLLVARADVSQLGEVHESARRLAQAGKTVSGVLLNAIDLNRRHYGSYGYKYGGYRYRHYSYYG